MKKKIWKIQIFNCRKSHKSHKSHTQVKNMLLLRKQYAECSIPLEDPRRLQNTIRNIYVVEDLHVAVSEGVLYLFRKDNVLLYASNASTTASTSATLLDIPSISRRILRATGSFPTLKTTFMTFETSVTMSSVTSTNILFLDFLHYNIFTHPPPGTEMNIFEPEIHADMIVKVGFKDGFKVTFHFQHTGKSLVVCDATNCEKAVKACTFKKRLTQVIRSFHEDINWG